MTPRQAAGIANIPVPAHFGGVRRCRDILINDVNAINRKTRKVPRVNEPAQVGALPAERTDAILCIGRGNGGVDRAACSAYRRGGGR